MVKLDASASAEIGYLGVAVMTRSFDLPTAPNFVMAGYGEDRRYALAGNRHCRILRWDTGGQVVVHDCRAVGGTAGAPLIGIRDGRYYIYAVNSAGVDKLRTSNVAVPSFAFFEAVRDATKQNEMILEDGLLVLPGRVGKQ